jgi:hypothetical protein
LTRVREWLLAVVGVLAGAVVHLAWDGFTHEEGRGVRMVPELSDPLLEVHDHTVTGAVLLQGLSSLVGLFIVIVAIAYALRTTGGAPVGPRALSGSERRRWVFGFVTLTLALCVAFYVLARVFGEPYHHWMGLGLVAVAFLRAVFVAALLTGLLMTVRAARRPGPQPYRSP